MRQPCTALSHVGQMQRHLWCAFPVAAFQFDGAGLVQSCCWLRSGHVWCDSCRFGDAAAGVFGSGWAWLQVDPSSKDLAISTTSELSCCQTEHTARLQRFDCSQLHSLPSTISLDCHGKCRGPAVSELPEHLPASGQMHSCNKLLWLGRSIRCKAGTALVRQVKCTHVTNCCGLAGVSAVKSRHCSGSHGCI